MKVKVTLYEVRKSFIIVEAKDVDEAGDKIQAQIDEGNLPNSLNWTIEMQRVDSTEES